MMMIVQMMPVLRHKMLPGVLIQMVMVTATQVMLSLTTPMNGQIVMAMVLAITAMPSLAMQQKLLIQTVME